MNAGRWALSMIVVLFIGVVLIEFATSVKKRMDCRDGYIAVKSANGWACVVGYQPAPSPDRQP